MNIIFSCEFFSTTEEELNSLEAAYPGVNVPIELRKMDMWLRLNPTRRKKRYDLFVNNWLKRTHNNLLVAQVRGMMRENTSRRESSVGTGPQLGAGVRVKESLRRAR